MQPAASTSHTRPLRRRSMMQLAVGAAELRRTLAPVHGSGRPVVLVPTMGNLHDGHLELVRQARICADAFIVASIFVNPFQFGHGEDFESYPRTLESDCIKLEAQDCDLAFIPEVVDIYPRGPTDATHVEVAALGDTLCGASRPGFFRGVSTVVNILFNIVQPQVAVFGEKDYQQLLVIRRMVCDLHMPVDILGVSTVREPDGLAMSSRNGYLDTVARAKAPALYQTLCALAQRIRSGDRDFDAVEARGAQRLEQAGFEPDYVAVRRATDLSIPTPCDAAFSILAAAQLGGARLIDNVRVDVDNA